MQPRFPDRLAGITAGDLQSFADGSHARLWRILGAHPSEEESVSGVRFTVWAPNASRVSVIGDFNHWDDLACPMERGESGIWSAFVPDAAVGARYKFHVEAGDDFEADKSDPFALHAEVAPANASVVWDLEYSWGDAGWAGGRGPATALDSPVSIYEMHLGSWMRPPEPGRYLSYRELAPRLIEYLGRLRFTHVEFLPLMEHPLYASWGYQTTGYFAPTSRYGTPQDLKYLIDQLHQAGFAVIMDWVPSHFPTDDHGLGFFDGTHLYEHEDPRQGFHPDWTSFIFNYGKPEVRSFLLSSAAFWLSEYHADALRVDGVSSMIYLDYSRGSGEWAPNRQGGRENTDATEFLRGFNERIYLDQPDAQTIAEESTDWPMVSRPTVNGGLGFGYKWDLGWMHDTLRYLRLDPALRKHHHNELTFRMLYAYSENFVLPLSHDEVVHGKGPLIGRMPGDEWQRFANLRLLYGYQYGQPGKKLLFMGGELAQTREWRHDHPLDWELLEQPRHAGVSQWVTDLNRLYREEPALHAGDCDPSGFEWIAADDREASVVSHLRRAPSGKGTFLLVYNFTPVPRHNYRIGVPSGGAWREMANSDSEYYGGSGLGNLGLVEAQEVPAHGRPWSLDLTLPPLACLFLKSTG